MSELSRRDFLKLMAAGSTGLAFAPFVPFGNFMPNPATASIERVPLIYIENKKEVHANINKFAVNSSVVATYPRTGDKVLDEEAFRKWQLIRLPQELGGAKNDVSAFRVYSMICLHLWCLWSYWSDDGRKRGECPCHGSMYDARTGKAAAGPASVQAAPSNVLPKLDIEADAEGFLYILPPNFNVNENGVVGYGRFLKEDK